MKNYKNELTELIENSYSPYSSFKVASIVVTDTGHEYKGVNVESSSFTPTICAERNAIGSAISAGAEAGTIKEVHILAKNHGDIFVEAHPCGVCRQVISEQSKNKARIFIYGESDTPIETNIETLLPNAFSGEDL
jgi:cytidine deaminase